MITTMITEDYVSFETAKLLKEKGFDEKVLGYYHIWDNGNNVCSVQEFSHSEAPHLYIPAPTLQMAMKWLREVHKVNIEIHYNRFGENYKYLIIYKPEVLDDIRSLGVFYSYEETVEEAIRYCLENLI